MATNTPYPVEQIEWLREYYPTHSLKDTHKAFNEHFSLNLTPSQVRHRVQKYNIKTCSTGRFTKGRSTWNKGMDMAIERPDIYAQWKNGFRYRFKKGHKPKNTKPIGTESVYKDFIIVKVSNAEWRPRARVVYEKTHNCTLSPKDRILHLDGNKFNDDPDNLMLVNDAILARLNKKKLITADAELTKSAVLQEQLLQEVHEIETTILNS